MSLLDEARQKQRQQRTPPPREPITVTTNIPDIAWPTLDDAAFHGLAGEIVQAVMPYTEADPVAILAQLLVAFGNQIGRGPHFRPEETCHYSNEFIALVGETSTSRKTSSWSIVRRIIGDSDEQWRDHRIMGGLSSGEGLIEAVRDDQQKKDQRGEVTTVPGVDDKRLMVIESELANVLKQFERNGNILSAIMRQAWDSDTLRTMTKTAPASCRAPHISIIANVTSGELKRLMTTTEGGNGLGNRFLWLLVKRSKCLPDGNPVPLDLMTDLQAAYRAAYEFAKDVSLMYRSGDAVQLWRDIYPELSEGRPGLAGALTARNVAHVMRLSGLYALMDRQCTVEEPHLRAALALWEYAAASVRYIWGDSLGDPTADDILDELRQKPEGMTRTQIRDHFQRHKPKGEIDRALRLLSHARLATQCEVQTEGRPIEVWHAAPLRHATEAT